MKNSIVVCLMLIAFNSCNSQSNIQIVSEFIESCNINDSIKHFQLIHDDFTYVWEDNSISIESKTIYSNNYSWGKAMNAHEDYEILSSNDSTVTLLSTYYSYRDSILAIGPYKSLQTYYFEDGKIIKIMEGKFDGYDAYNEPRTETYDAFFMWLKETHYLTINDYSFDRKGALALRVVLDEYNVFIGIE